MRKQIVAGNWKMNNTLDEGVALASEVIRIANEDPVTDVDLVLIPPFVHLSEVGGLISESAGIYLGAQNCSSEVSGAYTGEVSASMIASSGATHVIIGHSERREYFQEKDEVLARKVDQALSSNLTPIFCCGEPLDIREAGTHESYVTSQIEQGLFHLEIEAFSKVVIAYEPIWAIGTGKTASSEQAQEMHKAIRSRLDGQYGADAAQACSILYGGSAKPSNAPELFAQPDVDGGLIGGASLNADDFVAIARSFA